MNLTSLEVLHITGNVTWDIPAPILELPKLRQINGSNMRATKCSVCSLLKGYGHPQEISGFRLKEQGYQIRSKCLEENILLHRKFLHLLHSQFFPRCVLTDRSCRDEFATFEERNRCLELGAPILLASALVAVVSFTANLIVVVAITAKSELRTKPSMMLAASLATGDMLYSMFIITIGIAYQVLTPEDFESKLDEMCPYLAFIVIFGFALASHISFLITLEKYLVIVYGLKPHLHMRAKATRRCIFVSCLCAILAGLLITLLPNLPREEGTCLPMLSRETTASAIFAWAFMLLHTFGYFSAVALYARIFTTARKSGNRVGVHREGQLLKSIGVVVGTNFLFGFVPLVFVFVSSPLLSRGVIDSDLWFIFGGILPLPLASLNALIDPFLYVYRNPHFKNILKRKWDQIKPKKTPKKDTNKGSSGEAVVIVNFRRLAT